MRRQTEPGIAHGEMSIETVRDNLDCSFSGQSLACPSSDNPSSEHPAVTAAAFVLLSSPAIRRTLRRSVLADGLCAPHSLLHALSTNGRHASAAFVVICLLFTLLLWIPAWMLSLVITEGRCTSCCWQ